MKKLSVESTIVIGFATAIILMLLAGGQMYRSLLEYKNTSDLIAQTNQLLDSIGDVRSGVGLLVSSQRNFIITDKEPYLLENEREEAQIRAALVRINQLTVDNTRLNSRSTVLTKLTEERLKLLSNNTRLYRDNGFAAARDRIMNGSSGISMAALINLCDEMATEEKALLKQRTSMANHNADQALVVGGLLVVTTLTGLPFMWWRVRRTAKERQASDSMIADSIMMKQVSDNLMLEDTINRAYGDILTLINQDWFNMEDMTQAALTQFNRHVSITAGVCYLAQNNRLIPISSLGIPLPEDFSGIAMDALKRNAIVALHDIPADSILNITTSVGSVVPHEIIAVPLSVKNEIVAVVELASLRSFSETDLRIINLIAPQLGFGIQQRKLELEVKDRSAQIETANFELQTINEESQTLNNALQMMNEELQAQQLENAESNRRLEEVSLSKSDFLANMSHELRTPLNSVIGFSEVLQDQMFGPINEKQQEYVENILTSGRHLLSMINDILDLSKVESGNIELGLGTVSLRETIETSLMMLREKALKGGINLRMNLSQQADVYIVADQRKLKQIMFNLVSNAVKFTPAGGSVDINAERDGDFIQITVADTGIGIQEQDIPKLFKPFTQLESVYTKEFEGTGLGLALTRQLVELHGGRVWVKSEFGSGSRFCFTIPLVPIETKESSGIRPNSSTIQAATVLLIEDDTLTLTALKTALQSKGYTVLLASNGEDGIKLARLYSPALIILDLMMPGMNGFDVGDILRKDKTVSQIPVLILTAMNLSTADRARLKGKVWRIVEKGSLSTQELISLVESAVAPH
jgi:signal transduction histidine kinase/CHASE3 domain sensor protein/CheY-like chemotaxis protein